MFTGLIEIIGTVKSLRQAGGSARLTVEVGSMASELGIGESVAVSGACLTVTAAGGAEATFDVVNETLRRSNLADAIAGDRVNIERAVKAGGRLGGHFVQGHVDGVGTVSRVSRGDAVEIEVSAPSEVTELLVPKGSIAVDGVSLTLARCNRDRFVVAVIPHTLENTTLGCAKPGDKVNLEADILGKYVRSMLKTGGQGEGSVTESLLRDSGFM